MRAVAYIMGALVACQMVQAYPSNARAWGGSWTGNNALGGVGNMGGGQNQFMDMMKKWAFQQHMSSLMGGNNAMDANNMMGWNNMQGWNQMGGGNSWGQNLMKMFVMKMMSNHRAQMGGEWGQGKQMGGQWGQGKQMGGQWGKQMGGQWGQQMGGQWDQQMGGQWGQGKQMGGQWGQGKQMGGQWGQQMGGQWGQGGHMGGSDDKSSMLLKVLYTLHHMMEDKKEDKDDMMSKLGEMMMGGDHDEEGGEWMKMVWSMMEKMMEMKGDKKDDDDDDDMSFDDILEHFMKMKEGGDKKMEGISKEDMTKWKMWKQMEDMKKLSDFITKYQGYQEKEGNFKDAMVHMCFIIDARVENSRVTGQPLFTRTNDVNMKELEEQVEGLEDAQVKAVINEMAINDTTRYNEVFFRMVQNACKAGGEIDRASKEMMAMAEEHMKSEGGEEESKGGEKGSMMYA